MTRLFPTIILALLLAQPLCLHAAPPPLPQVNTVLERVAEKSKKEAQNDRAFKEQYCYLRTKITESLNHKGEVKSREQKRSRNDPRVIPASQRTERANVRPDTERQEGIRTNTGTNSTAKSKPFEKTDFTLDRDLLSRFRFTVTGRELVNGRPSLIVDFRPANGKLPERNFKDRFINKAAGRVWVDEADYVLVKANLYLTEPVRVVGGLVGAVKAFRYGFIRERTAEGLWFARNVDWHVEGREVFVRRAVVYHEQTTDVRRAW